MRRFLKRTAHKAGLPPGTLVHIGEQKTAGAVISVIDYDETHFESRELREVEECLPFKEKPTVTWFNVNGIHDIEIIEKLGRAFNLHPLLLEDIVNTGQRPKMDDFDDYLFLVLKMISYDEADNTIHIEQVSLILGANFVISFQEAEGDVFNPVRERIREGKGRIRKMNSDYLAYSLIDAIVDNYFVALEKLGEDVEELQEELLTEPGPETLDLIHTLKREMIYLRKSVWPLREAISSLQRGESSLIGENVAIYVRDVYDHTIQVIDAVETFRDMLSGMLDIYLSSLSNKMNEVMKVLTIIATIFIPLTFVAGIYGMNFKYMPELEWRWGYPAVLLVIVALSVVMLILFKKKKWF